MEYHFIEPTKEEKQGILEYLKRNYQEVKKEDIGNVEVLGYIACNNGIRHGPSMGVTHESMKKDSKEKFGENSKLWGMIMNSFEEVPESIRNSRLKATSRFGNEPFDAIVYRKIA